MQADSDVTELSGLTPPERAGQGLSYRQNVLPKGISYRQLARALGIGI
jgi:hypothetical protein